MSLFLKTKDFSVSNESFELHLDSELEMLKTHPQPDELLPYYDSKVYISHTDSKTSFVDRLYHYIKRLNLRKKVQLIENQGHKSRVLLDYGAGTGDFLAMTCKRGFYGEGVEPNEKARIKAKSKKINLLPDLASLTHKKFDVITLWHVLEHLPSLDTHIEQLKDLLNEDGLLVVAVPNFKSFDAGHYGAHWAAYDVPRHLWHFSRKSISKIFGKHHMEVFATKPMVFDAFYVSMLSEKYKENRLYLFRAFFVGMWSNIKAVFTGEYSSIIYLIKKRE